MQLRVAIHSIDEEKDVERDWFLLLMLVCLSLLAAPGVGASEKKEVPLKKGILLVAFGTSVPQAQSAYDRVEEAVKKAFPGMETRWAYTSKIIRAKLAKEGKRLDSPETALARMMEEGFSGVAVLSLHVIPGVEFHDLQNNVQLFSRMAGGIRDLAVARPLLSSHEDMVQVAEALLKNLPPSRTPGDLVLCMGHGSEKHPADAIYAAMNYVFEQLDVNVFVATVDGYPSIQDLLSKIVERKPRKVYLVPFMAVAGDHARNDMAGDGPESWKSILAGKGLNSETVLIGLAEYPEVIDVWLKHLREVLSES
jgi:sirohydrochlorin cobaltochelatase